MKKLRLFLTLCLLTSCFAVSAQQNGLNFDGTNDNAVLVAPSLPNYTIECWVRFTGSSTLGQNILVYTSLANGPQLDYSHQIFTNSAGRFCHYSFDGSAQTLTGTTIAAVNTWYHIAITGTSNSNIKLYVNGTLEGTPITVGSLWPGGNRIHIGGNTSLGSYLRGTVDEIRVWNHELCSAELTANKNGELLNPASQSGLERYYRCNQGTAAGTNTTISTLTDQSANNVIASLSGFAMTGSTSNFVAGATAITGALATNNNAWDVMATATTATTLTVSGSTQQVASNCALINRVQPSGSAPLTGTVAARTVIESSVRTFGGSPYLTRHYHLEPVTTPNTATATLTLYYTQAEFNAYNLVRGSLPSLPTSTSDVTNAANLRISQFHGVPTGGYRPENYPRTWAGSGPARVSIVPTSVTYNSTHGRWEVVFPVTGFSGFFASSVSASPLPLHLTRFGVNRVPGGVQLQWELSGVKSGGTVMVEKSSDGAEFTGGGASVPARSGTSVWFDGNVADGRSYYRLKLEDGDGEVSYSAVGSVDVREAGSFSVSPMPARAYIEIRSTRLGGAGAITDMQGRELLRFDLRNGTRVDISALPAGVYVLRTQRGETARVVVQ